MAVFIPLHNTKMRCRDLLKGDAAFELDKAGCLLNRPQWADAEDLPILPFIIIIAC